MPKLPRKRGGRKKEKENVKKDISSEISKKSASAKKKFVPPSVEEVVAYCQERENKIDAAHFVDYYTAGGWKMGRQDMKDWRAAVRSWEKNGIVQRGKGMPDAKDYSFDLSAWESAHKWHIPDFSPGDEEPTSEMEQGGKAKIG